MDKYEEAVSRDMIIDLNVNEPDWDPTSHVYSQQENNMLDFEGKIIEKKNREHVIFDMKDYDDDDPKYSISSVNVIPEGEALVSSQSIKIVNDGRSQLTPDNTKYDDSKMEALCEISNSLDHRLFAEALVEKNAMGKLQNSIGSIISAVSVGDRKVLMQKLLQLSSYSTIEKLKVR